MTIIERFFLKLKLWHLERQITPTFDPALSLLIDAVNSLLDG